MEIQLTETLNVPVRHVVTHVNIDDIDNYNHFSAVRLAKKYYERLGSKVIEGEDFENNMVIFLYGNDRLFYDNYTRVKIGRGTLTPGIIRYAEDVAAALTGDVIGKLLSICRLCSYAGGPGFPDIVALSERPSLKYVIFDTLSASQKLFLLLAKLSGIKVELIRLAKKESAETISINPAELFSSILSDRRAVSIMDGINANIEAEKDAMSAAPVSMKKIHQDEIDYLEGEKGKISLFLIKKWVDKGSVTSEDINETVSFILSNQKNDAFADYLTRIKSDAEFTAVTGKTEDSMRNRAEIMQRKFGIGKTRSKLMLNFF